MSFLSKIFAGGASTLIDKVGSVVDDLTLSKEEKEKLKIELIKATNDHEAKMAELAEKEFEAQLKDTESARNANVSLQTSDKTPLFNKVVPYAIACFTAIIWGGMTVYVIGSMLNIIKRDPGVNFEGVLGVYAGLTGTFMVVLNFFFGSSKGSEDKQKWMQKMMEK